MESMQEIMNELNLTPAQMQEFGETMKANPMAAFQLIQKFQIPSEVIQKLIHLFMTNPQLLSQMAEKAGISPELVSEVQANFVPPVIPSKE